MEKNDFYGFTPYDSMLNQEQNINDLYKDPMLNPMLQYEQGFMYYRYLCMQLEYRIKCKEYEKICTEKNSSTKETKVS